MKSFNITSKISLIAPVSPGSSTTATMDSQADFNQIILRVRNGNKFVNFLVTDLGETVTAQFWQDHYKAYEIRLTNDIRHEKAFQTLMAQHLL